MKDQSKTPNTWILETDFGVGSPNEKLQYNKEGGQKKPKRNNLNFQILSLRLKQLVIII